MKNAAKDKQEISQFKCQEGRNQEGKIKTEETNMGSWWAKEHENLPNSGMIFKKSKVECVFIPISSQKIKIKNKVVFFLLY